MSKKNIITIIGENQARLGFKFLFRGVSSECEDCKFNKACLNNLEQNRVYEVVKVTKKKLKCQLHGDECKVVEVVEKSIECAVESRFAIQDALIEFNLMKCEFLNCENYEKCVPVGLFDKDRCKVLEVKQKIKCPKGYELTLTSLLRQSYA